MELKMHDVQFPQVIEFNFEELKKEITDKAELYKNMVYTDDTIKEAKADKAAEAEKRQELQADPVITEEKTPSQPAKEPQTEAAASWIRFEACMTVEQAMKLKQFFEVEGISFRAI